MMYTVTTGTALSLERTTRRPFFNLYCSTGMVTSAACASMAPKASNKGRNFFIGVAPSSGAAPLWRRTSQGTVAGIYRGYSYLRYHGATRYNRERHVLFAPALGCAAQPPDGVVARKTRRGGADSGPHRVE